MIGGSGDAQPMRFPGPVGEVIDFFARQSRVRPEPRMIQLGTWISRQPGCFGSS